MKLSVCPDSLCTHCAKWVPNESCMKNHIAMIVTNADALMEYICRSKRSMASWSRPRVYHLYFHQFAEDIGREKKVFGGFRVEVEQWDVLGCLFLHRLQHLHHLPYLQHQVLEKILMHGQQTVSSQSKHLEAYLAIWEFDYSPVSYTGLFWIHGAFYCRNRTLSSMGY